MTMKGGESKAAAAAASSHGSNPTGCANALSDKKNNPSNDINVLLDEAFEWIQLDGYSTKSVEEAFAEILTMPGDESLEVSSSGVTSTIGAGGRVYSRIASRLVTTSTLTTAWTSEDDKSVSNQSVEICSGRSVLVKSRMSDVSVRTTANSAATSNTRSTTEHSTLSRQDTDDAQASVEVNLSGQPVSTTSDITYTSSGDDDDDSHEGNFEVDSNGLVAYQTDRHCFHCHHHQHHKVDIPSLECATAKDDPLEQSSNNLPTSRATNVASNATRSKMNMMNQETMTSNTEHWSYDLQALPFTRTSSSLTSTGTRKKMENISQNTLTGTKNQSYGNEDSSPEVDMEDHIVIRTREASNVISAVQQAKTKPFPNRSLASKSRSEAAGQSSHEVELEDLLTAPTRITSNMTSPQSKTNHPLTCFLPPKCKSYRCEEFEIEDLTVASTRTIELGGFGSDDSDDSLLLKEDEKETSLVRSATAPENCTLLQIVEVPQVPFMGKEQHSSGGGVDIQKLLTIRRTSTRDTEEELFDEEAQPDAAFEVTVHDSEQTIAVMLLEEWMESSLQKSGKRQQQWDKGYRRMKQVIWSLVVVMIVAGILSAAAPIFMRSSL